MQNQTSDTAAIATGFAVWWRASRRCKWKLVGTAASQLAALGLMGTANGHWLLLEGGKDPNSEDER